MQKKWLTGLALAACLAASSMLKAAPGDAVTDASQAGPDYLVQGEYTGKRLTGDKIGIQVMALGGGGFQGVLYPGGLPGDGWDGKIRLAALGKTEGDATVFPGGTGGWSGTIKDGKLSLRSGEGTCELVRVERKSPTLGMKPPSAALVLFDGRAPAEAWEGGRVTPDGLLEVGTRTKQSFGDFKLHFEFRTPYMPAARGQGRGNSGLFLQGRYEVQILDSFALTGKDNECGGVYSLAAPKVNMCLPPLAWQTWDVDFTSARFDAAGNKTAPAILTLKHNGVIVHDRLELKGPSPSGRAESAAGGPLTVQNHGNPVHFRNIWLVEGN